MLTASGHEEVEESEAFDSMGNPLVDPEDLTRGAGRRNQGAEEREKIHISVAAWDKARDAMSGTTPMTADATREELMAYQYLLHRARREIAKMKTQLDAEKSQPTHRVSVGPR